MLVLKYEGHSEIIDNTFPNEDEINLRFNYVKVFIVGIGSFFRPVEPRPEERKKVNFWKEPQLRLYSMINFPPSQNCNSLCAFSQFWKQKE